MPETANNNQMRIVSVAAPHFVAGFETDGIVRRTAPILKRLKGKTDAEAREIIRQNGWHALIVPALTSPDPETISS